MNVHTACFHFLSTYAPHASALRNTTERLQTTRKTTNPNKFPSLLPKCASLRNITSEGEESKITINKDIATIKAQGSRVTDQGLMFKMI